VGNHPVRERRALFVRRVRADAFRSALLDLLVELDELRAGQLGDRPVEPTGEVLSRLVLEGLDRPWRAILLLHSREVRLHAFPQRRPDRSTVFVSRRVRVAARGQLHEHGARPLTRELDGPELLVVTRLLPASDLHLHALAAPRDPPADDERARSGSPRSVAADDDAEPAHLVVPEVRLRVVDRARQGFQGLLG
jgi:hypothetical protein